MNKVIILLLVLIATVSATFFEQADELFEKFKSQYGRRLVMPLVTAIV